MTLPETFTLVRHGRSEANVIQQELKKAGVVRDIPEGLFDRHDSAMRLAADGVPQAQAAGAWLRAHGPAFDRFYVSPHIRTRETAAHLGLNGAWRVDDRFRERDWGEVQYIDREGHDPLSEASRHWRRLTSFYWAPPGGESQAGNVRLRAESVMNSLYRKDDIHHVIGVAHGEFMAVARLVIERMTPDLWEQQDADPAYKIRNCMILQYSRIDPNNPDGPLNDHYKWRRAICPWDENKSWDGGEWVRIHSPKFTDADLLASVEQVKPLL
jgi:broad specificity phosphatase PhoE